MLQGREEVLGTSALPLLTLARLVTVVPKQHFSASHQAPNRWLADGLPPAQVSASLQVRLPFSPPELLREPEGSQTASGHQLQAACAQLTDKHTLVLAFKAE